MRSSTFSAGALSPVAAGLMLCLCLSGGCSENVPPSAVQTEDVRKAVAQANLVHTEITPAIASDRDLDDYLQEVGNRLLSAARSVDPRGTLASMKVRFYLVRSPVANVCSVGGEQVYVSNDLFSRCGTEEELAAAMAHALAHLQLRHAASRARLPETEKNALVLVNQFAGAPYTGRENSEAQEVAFNLYARAGWDPLRFGDVFQRLSGQDYQVRDAVRRAQQLSVSAQSWRKSPVADDRTFLQLQQRARSLPMSTASRGGVILRALPNCFVPDDPQVASARRELQQMAMPPVTDGVIDLHGGARGSGNSSRREQ